MANRNEDQDAAGPQGDPPESAPRPGGGDAAPRAPDGFLPDDSFLLDVDDDDARAPAPMADAGDAGAGSASGEEWIVVDDDLAASEPAVAAQAGEPAAENANDAAAAPQTKVPKWYAGEESDLPSFAAEDGEAANAVAPVAATPQPSAAAEPAALEPAEAVPVAPILSLANARARRLKLAAAALVVALGATAAFIFQTRNGGGSDEASDVASAPRGVSRTAPVEAPADPVEPVVEAPPVDVAPEPIVAPPLVAADPIPAVATPLPVERPNPAPTTAPVAVDPGRKRPLPGPVRDPRTGAAGPKDDTIVELKNGHTFRGQITRVKGTRVTLRVGAGECVFDLADVSLLDSTAPEYRRIDQMPEASVLLASGQHLRGRLMKQTPERVVLVVNNGQLVFARADIRDVSFTGRIHF